MTAFNKLTLTKSVCKYETGEVLSVSDTCLKHNKCTYNALYKLNHFCAIRYIEINIMEHGRFELDGLPTVTSDKLSRNRATFNFNIHYFKLVLIHVKYLPPHHTRRCTK